MNLARLIAVAALGGLCGSGTALALPDAKIDQQIRPNFGRLLSPPVRKTYRPDPWRAGRWRGPLYPVYPGQHRPLLAQSLTVDCGDPRGGPTPLADALYDLADHGVLYIRSRGGVCTETLEIAHPVIIVGEGIPTFAAGSNPAPAKLAPVPGAPCIRIAPGVKGVEIRDLVIEANQAGRYACIESLDADVALVRVRLSYAGDASAIYVAGGSLVVRDSTFTARTNDAAIQIDAAVADFQRVKVVADVRGFDITPAPGDSKLVQVGILAERGGGSTGVTVRDLRSGGGRLLIANSVISGWASGVYLDRGAQVDILRTRILHARRGVTADLGQVSLRESAIWADEYGGYFSGGNATVEFNRLIGAPRGLVFEQDTVPRMQPNYVYSPVPCPPYGSGGPSSYCLPMNAMPREIGDEDGFEAPDRSGWELDGYERGYLRDGPPRPLPPPPPPRRGLFRR